MGARSGFGKWVRDWRGEGEKGAAAAEREIDVIPAAFDGSLGAGELEVGDAGGNGNLDGGGLAG